ncbi:YifB family Mg chelatase-like AAA ATPase [Alistipes finegoldii]|uniref:YifB family Mg chelatase-like AAA ATPase n=1 Tax=Alistipes finegoldii TaxID=214856 RepID=UPI002FDD4EBF
MFVRTYAGAIVGIDAAAVTVEVNIAGGGLGMYLVGLPDSAVKESEQRIRAAFENSGERMSGRKVVVSLAPADLRKEGASFDLPIAVGILAAMSRVNAETLAGTMFAGELSLDGTLKPVRGVLPMAVRAREEGLRRLVLPAANAAEAAVVEGVEVIGAGSLKEVIGLLNGEREMTPAVPADGEPFGAEAGRYEEDFADVKGQTHVKRALEIAAAGGHNVLMIGAPGSGKTMLARRMPTILPPLSREEALETTKIHSVAGNMAAGGLLARRPFRAPHHTISQAARFAGTEGVHTNAMMNVAMLREYCRPDAASAALLERAMERLSLSARAYDRILKVARTIADLAGRETIAAADVAEAINYRSLDRGNWGR